MSVEDPREVDVRQPADRLRERIQKARLRASMSIEDEDDDMLSTGEYLLGVPGASNKILVGEGGTFKTITEHPANPGFAFTADGATINGVKEIRTDVAPERLVHGGGLRLNPIMKALPGSNIVTYFPTYISPGPRVFESLLKGSLGIIMGLIQRAAKERSDAR